MHRHWSSLSSCKRLPFDHMDIDIVKWPFHKYMPGLSLRRRCSRPRSVIMSSGRLGRLCPKHSALLVCDVQERFRTVIQQFEAVVDTSKRMVKGAELLQIPVVVSEQYPKALGATVDEIKSVLPAGTIPVPKTDFSMCVAEVKQELAKHSDIHQVLIIGIEAHVCVFQTTLDLLEQGMEVHLVTDGISSSRLADRAIALQRMQQAGAFLTTSEMCMFQLMGGAKHPAFKGVSALAKEQRPKQLPALHSNL